MGFVNHTSFYVNIVPLTKYVLIKIVAAYFFSARSQNKKCSQEPCFV